jgi:hypothetical protein
MQQQLLVQSLMLSRAPDVARTAEFQSRLSAWFAREQTRAETKDEQSRNINPVTNLVTAENSEASASNAEQRDSSAPASARKTSTPRPDEQTRPLQDPIDADYEGRLKRQEEEDSGGTNDIRSASDANLQTGLTNPATQTETSTSDTESLRSSASSNNEKPQYKDTMPSAGPARVETAFGGVFFLLNVALALEFYPDFSRPLDACLDVNIWDFLAILGDRFTQGKLCSDPIWKTLARLAGRGDPEDPGAQNPWLLAPGEAWIDALAAQVTDFLVRSLDLENAAEFLCHLPAFVTATPTHVDVFYSMQTHPIEIRIACLDRDPGWIPAAGRYVAYHFD